MYEKKISRAQPGLIANLLDDSGSMAENLLGTSDPKFKWVERLYGVNLKDLLAKSTELKGDEAQIKPRFYTYNIIYGSYPKIWGPGEMDIKATAEKYTNDGNSLGLGGLLDGTDSNAAFQKVYDYLKEAVKTDRVRQSFPPMIWHLSDGMSATDATPSVDLIKQLSTEDGNVLIANVYIGIETNLQYKGPEDFPGYVDVREVGPSEDNIRLFNMSSEVPACIRQNLIDDGIFPNIREKSRLLFDVRIKDMLKHAIQVCGSIGSRADRTAR
jgi:hypothetical protein